MGTDGAEMSPLAPTVNAMRAVFVSDLVSRILAASDDRLRLIGIDGPSASGKTTLAGVLAERLAQATVIRTDDFVAWKKSNWWPRFEREVLEPLLTGVDARYQIRDWHNDQFGTSLGPWKTSPASDIIVVEGVGCTRRAVADRLSYTVWVEAPYEVRLQRGLDRDGDDHRQVWLDWMKEEAESFTEDGARARADIRISTAGPRRSSPILGELL